MSAGGLGALEDAMRVAQEAGNRTGLAGSAFAWAQDVAKQVGRPIAVHVPAGRHTARYWIVAVEWQDWSGGGPLGPRQLHLARAWLTPHGKVDDRSAGLVGTHPENAVPHVTSEESVDLPVVGDAILEHVAAEAPRVSVAYGLAP